MPGVRFFVAFLLATAAAAVPAAAGVGAAVAAAGMYGGLALSEDDPILRSLVLISVEAAQAGAAEGSPASYMHCSGVLIDPEAVLTAAHCFPRGSPPPEPCYYSPSDTARDGALLEAREVLVRFNTRPQRYRRAYYRTHPSYCLIAPYVANPNDIAVLYLGQPAPEGAVPAVLPSGRGFDLVQIAGFGMSNLDLEHPVFFRGSAQLPVRYRYPGMSASDPYSHCLGDNCLMGRREAGPGAMPGDSGGPAYRVETRDGRRVVTNEVVAIIQSVGALGEDPQGVTYVQDVRLYSDWIASTISALRAHARAARGRASAAD